MNPIYPPNPRRNYPGYMNQYESCKEWILGGRSKTDRPILRYVRLKLEGENVIVRLHWTDILILFPNGEIKFTFQRWHSNLTRRWAKRFMPQNWGIYRTKGETFIYRLKGIDEALETMGPLERVLTPPSKLRYMEAYYESWHYKEGMILNHQSQRINYNPKGESK